MTLLAIVTALLLEHASALSSRNSAHAAFRRYAAALEHALDTGRYQHGVLAWLAAVAPIVLAVAALAVYLHDVVPLVALVFDVVVLYLTMGFRQFSRAYGAALDALRTGDASRAAVIVSGWNSGAIANVELSSNDVARVAIARALLSAHRHVFAVIAWFVVCGAAGAVGYRLAELLYEHWTRRGSEDSEFGTFSRRAFEWIDWAPARLTALSFAVVGDFEDALYCWRTQARGWSDATEGVVLASGAGAIGVRLGYTVGAAQPVQLGPELGMGDEADAELMTSTIGLVWRAVALWLFVILLVTVANWLG